MSHKWAPLWLAIAGGMLLIASSKRDDMPQPGKLTEIDIAYMGEADLMRVAGGLCIQRLQNGELTSDREVRDWLAAAAKESHNQIWSALAKKDAEAFKDGWTAEKHIARIREMIGNE